MMNFADTNSAVVIPAQPATNAFVATNDIRAIRPPVPVPGEWTWLWWTLGALAAMALLVWAWRKFGHRLVKPPVIPVTPAHVRAREKLAGALALIEQPKPFCSAVSETLRVYLEERFDFHAPERTTEEFLIELRATTLLSEGQKLGLSEFLSRCDLVKFAKYEPARPELEDLHAAAMRLVDETTPRFQSEQPAASPQPSVTA
ncbi:MAG: hypothetical protein HY300_06200 [Verrucomicrobia bacterium]|nr:hypothetical protein [Verrucomicrobiota bacterium]